MEYCVWISMDGFGFLLRIVVIEIEVMFMDVIVGYFLVICVIVINSGGEFFFISWLSVFMLLGNCINRLFGLKLMIGI